MDSEDPELAAIRQKRMQQLMSQQGKTGGISPEEMQRQEEAKREANDQRQALLRQILEPEAKARLSRVSLVKPEKAKRVEDMILAQATSGRLPGKITEDVLINILEQVSEGSGRSSSKVTFQRRRDILDDDD